MKKITFVCAIAMLVAFALPAQAAVQNVKVSGDITIRAIYRGSLDLDDDDDDTTVNPNVSTQGSEDDEFLMMSVGVNIEADLTDNVSAKIRLINQRDIDDPEWGGDEVNNFDVHVDLAYITLKEMLYSPLTIIVGRQDLWYGDGLIVGAKLRDVEGSISADEFTEIASFDAIRAILDYDPWTIDLLYSKIEENEVDYADDIDLYGVNVGYVFGEYDAEAEAYYFCKHDSSTNAYPGVANEVHTIGIRGSVVPLENLDLRGEVAGQFGDYAAGGSTSTADRSAWAVNGRGEYCWADYAWLPTLGLEYVYFSGDAQVAAGDSNTGDYEQWDPMYRGKFFSAIREWQGTTTVAVGGLYPVDDTSADAEMPGNTNQHQIIVDGSLQPTDNILVAGRYIHFVAAEDDAQGDDDIGDEVDLNLTYEYTEDVTFSLLAAWFFPGDVFASPNDATASEVVGTVSLVF